MARMFPAEISPEVKSAAEIKVFDLIRTGLGGEWTALHSLGLTGHYSKQWAEIDFVLVGPAGVFCLEVKGGRIARQDGDWLFIDRNGNINRKSQGPFEQVGPANAALRNHLIDKIPRLVDATFGYGVLTPDVQFTVTGPDIEPELVYDARDNLKPFSAYVTRLTNYWNNRLKSRRQGVPTVPLRDEDRKAILDEIRGDFDLRPSLRMRVGYAVDELLRLTAEQYRILDGLAENDQVIVRGAAGTGKTLLAVEEARKRAATGERVLFCCYSRALSAYLRQALKDASGVEVRDIQSLAVGLIDAAGMRYRLPKTVSPEDLINLYPELAQEALIHLDRLQEYDVLIIDEAQDLLSKSYLDLFDALLKGGLNDGKWRFFLDPLQDVFLGSHPEQIKRLEALRPAKFHLTVNCRNTSPVAAAGSLLSGVLSPTTLTVEGPDVEWQWYRDREHARREISKCVGRLLSEGFKPSEITVLSLRPREQSSLREGLVNVPYPMVDTEDAIAVPHERAIRYTTTGNFKGLESKVVLLVDVDTLAEAETLFSLYVGASRAIALLVVFIAETQRAAYAVRAGEYAGKLVNKPGEAERRGV